MTLSEISIRRPVFAWMLMSALIIFGGICFFRMGISQLPDVDFPIVTVNLRLEGAAPQVIESEIIDYIENAVMGIQGARRVTSRSENSEGTVKIEFDIDRNLDLAIQDVQAKISQIQSLLPREITALTISKTNPDDQPIMLLSLESEKHSLNELMYYVTDRLKNQFAMVPGVGDVTLNGFTDPNLRIWVSNDALNRYELSVVDVITAVQSEHSEQPAGQIVNDKGDRMFYVRTLGEAANVKQFGDIVINQRAGLPNYRRAYLNQVARVEDGLADVLTFNRVSGVPGIGLGILKQHGSNAVAVAHAVKSKLETLQKTLPSGMRLAINFDSTRYVEEAVSELNFTLILSAILTALVCWMFLGSWTSTVNVLFSIPTSIVGTFIVLYFSGFTLNIFTLLGLSLSIGIVVDDAIMVLENIVRHQEKNNDRVVAALLGAQEITFAAIAATISIVAIFLPVVFMKGVIGKYFFHFGITITVAVLLSLVEALTLTPMRCSQFVDHGKRTTIFGRAIEGLFLAARSVYSWLLIYVIRFRWVVILISLIMCGLSFKSLKYLNKEFLPAEDQSRFLIRFKTPIGSSIAFTNAKLAEAEAYLKSRPEIDRYIMKIGGGSPGDANTGQATVKMKERGQRGIDKNIGHEMSQREFMDFSKKELKKINGLRVNPQDLSIKAFTASRGFPIEFTLQGPEWDQLAVLAKQFTTELEKTDLVVDIDTDYEAAMPEYQIIPDRLKAAERGVSIITVGQTVSAMIGGVLVGRYPKGGHRYDIRLKLEETKENPVTKMKKLFVRNNRKELVALSELVNIQEKKSMSEINRNNRERAITFYANVKAGGSQERAMLSVQEIAKRILPPQYHIELSGSSQDFNESTHSLMLALVLGIIVAYMVLASQFNSFLDPLTVLMTLPFSVAGALAALYFAHQTINVYSMIGIILLMGIVKKNSILLVDFTNQVRDEENLTVREALLKACPIRLRPILMTSIATIAGAIPAALSLGPGAESRIPMAVAVIGGTLVSTFLSLLLVPCVYSVLAHLQLDRNTKPPLKLAA